MATERETRRRLAEINVLLEQDPGNCELLREAAGIHFAFDEREAAGRYTERAKQAEVVDNNVLRQQVRIGTLLSMVLFILLLITIGIGAYFYGLYSGAADDLKRCSSSTAATVAAPKPVEVESPEVDPPEPTETESPDAGPPDQTQDSDQPEVESDSSPPSTPDPDEDEDDEDEDEDEEDSDDE